MLVRECIGCRYAVAFGGLLCDVIDTKSVCLLACFWCGVLLFVLCFLGGLIVFCFVSGWFIDLVGCDCRFLVFGCIAFARNSAAGMYLCLAAGFFRVTHFDALVLLVAVLFDCCVAVGCWCLISVIF